MSYNFDEYYDVREEFIYALDGQHSVNTNINPYDPTGQISRMASRGDSKLKITELLNKNSIFVANKARLADKSSVTDPIELAVLMLFEEFVQALDGLGDPPSPIDVREMAASALESFYVGSEAPAAMIRAGATSKDVLQSLDDVSSWSEALDDYITRADVEYVQTYQINRWGTLKDVLDIIRDIDLYS